MLGGKELGTQFQTGRLQQPNLIDLQQPNLIDLQQPNLIDLLNVLLFDLIGSWHIPRTNSCE